MQKEAGLLSLPEVQVSANRRPPEEVNGALLSRFGAPIVCLFRLGPSMKRSLNVVYQVAEVLEWRDLGPDDCEWLDTSHTKVTDLSEPPDAVAVAEAFEQLGIYEVDDTAPFGQLGWLPRLLSWVENETNWRPSNAFRQLNGTPQFSLICLEGPGGAIWFKATGGPNSSEVTITRALARFCPEFLPRIISYHDSWNGWLSVEAQGRSLDEIEDQAAWNTAGRRLAELQKSSITFTNQLLLAGCKDIRTESLYQRLPEFLTHIDRAQSNRPFVQQCRDIDLDDLRGGVLEALEAIEQLGLPFTVNHLDLNPSNVIGDESNCVILDWAEAAVGCPLISFEYLRRFFVQSQTLVSKDHEAFRASYDAVWSAAVPDEILKKGRPYIQVLAAYAFAVAWLSCTSSGEHEDNSRNATLLRLSRLMCKLSQHASAGVCV